jgi:cell division protein ZapA (FtsZ GTPase activity inhibitor)
MPANAAIINTMEETLIPVNILIADRSYRLKINASDEEVVRKTMKVINEKIVEYKTHFSGNDMQDYVAMVLLWFATEQQKPTVQQSDAAVNSEKLERLEEMLDKALSTI